MNKIDKYSINISWSDEDQSFVATSPIFGGLMAFGNTKEEALTEAQNALAGFLEILENKKEPLPDPDILETYSGQFRVRIPKTLHRRLSEIAQKEGVSLNQYIVSKLSGAEGEDRAIKHITTIYSHNVSLNYAQNKAEDGISSTSRIDGLTNKYV